MTPAPPPELQHLLSAAVQAVAAGARGLEAAVIVGADPSPADLGAVRDLGGVGVPVLMCAPDGSVRDRRVT